LIPFRLSPILDSLFFFLARSLSLEKEKPEKQIRRVFFSRTLLTACFSLSAFFSFSFFLSFRDHSYWLRLFFFRAMRSSLLYGEAEVCEGRDRGKGKARGIERERGVKRRRKKKSRKRRATKVGSRGPGKKNLKKKILLRFFQSKEKTDTSNLLGHLAIFVLQLRRRLLLLLLLPVGERV
jgi:hypothetical protein